MQASLIRLLAAAGQQAEALDVYESVRRRLADELGIDPGPDLKAARDIVLNPEAPTPLGDGAASIGAAVLGPPAQLPADLAAFTGRRAELARALALHTDRAAGETVVITAIGGMAGIEKTSLAVHWAHQIADRFPDGQLYLNLRGFDPAGQLVGLGDALAVLLEGLRVVAAQLPAALTWHAAEQSVVIAAISLAAEHGFGHHAWQLQWAASPFLSRRASPHVSIATLHIALDAVIRLSDPVMHSRILDGLGQAYSRADQPELAVSHLQQALALSVELGNRTQESHIHFSLARVAERRGRHVETVYHSEQALQICTEIGNEAGVGSALCGLGSAYLGLREARRAMDYSERALVIALALPTLLVPRRRPRPVYPPRRATVHGSPGRFPYLGDGRLPCRPAVPTDRGGRRRPDRRPRPELTHVPTWRCRRRWTLSPTVRVTCSPDSRRATAMLGSLVVSASARRPSAINCPLCSRRWVWPTAFRRLCSPAMPASPPDAWPSSLAQRLGGLTTLTTAVVVPV